MQFSSNIINVYKLGSKDLTRNFGILTGYSERGVLTDRFAYGIACDAPIHTLIIFLLASHNPTI